MLGSLRSQIFFFDEEENLLEDPKIPMKERAEILIEHMRVNKYKDLNDLKKEVDE